MILRQDLHVKSRPVNTSNCGTGPAKLNQQMNHETIPEQPSPIVPGRFGAHNSWPRNGARTELD